MPRVPEPEVMGAAEEARAYGEGDFRRVNAAFARRLAGAAGSTRGRALDLGTGPGDIPVLFCGLAPGWRVTALDLSEAMLDLARARVSAAGLSSRIELLRRDAKAPRLGSRRFDLVFSNSLLHHLEDPAPFWAHVRRLARSGAAIVVMDLRRPPDRARARKLVRLHASGASPLLRRLFHDSLLAAFTPGEVRQQLAAAGLGGLRVRATTDRHMVISGRRR